VREVTERRREKEERSETNEGERDEKGDTPHLGAASHSPSPQDEMQQWYELLTAEARVQRVHVKVATSTTAASIPADAPDFQ
jgi:hypothetical protein